MRTVVVKGILGMVALATAVSVPAFAQEKKAEINVLVGWSFQDGVDGTNSIPAGDGNIYTRVDPKDSFKWGIGGGALVGPNYEVGFMFSQAMSKLTLGGTKTTEVGDMTVNNYHGYFGYNFLEPEAPARPYFFFGLGATSFGSIDYTKLNGQPGNVGSNTKFSTTWGLGVKLFPDRPVGVRLGIQWTPTYISSEATGYWCDPYWGCYATGTAKYANQWDLGGGISFRF